jgi:hypothetical protein
MMSEKLNLLLYHDRFGFGYSTQPEYDGINARGKITQMQPVAV